jgi:Domain of unknown function (DUF4105)
VQLLTLTAVVAVVVLPDAPPDAGSIARAARLGAHLRVELLTMGPGAETYSRFGHSALRVTDRRGVGDIVFNFGTFDHEDPAVVSKFLAGTLQYWLSVSTFAETQREYRAEGRRLIAQELRLTPLQRRRLFTRLYAMSQPAKRRYRYHHYHANCATRIRDVLDEVMGGSLRRQLSGRPAHTYRRWLRRATRGAPLFHLGFDLVLTRADKRISTWEACFTPEQLMRAMVATRVKVDPMSSVHAPGSAPLAPFVAKTRVLLPGPAFGEEVGPWFALAPWTWVVIIAWLLLALAVVPLVIRPARAWAWRLTGGVLALWGLVTTLVSVMMIYVWCISDLPVFTGNQNLVLLPPTVLAWIVLGVVLVIRPPSRRRLGRWLGTGLWGLAVVHALTAVVYTGVRVLVPGLARQGNTPLLAVAVPWALAIVWIVYRARASSDVVRGCPPPLFPRKVV